MKERTSDAFGERLRLARESKELSQAQLGARIGIGAGSISQWERGTSQPRADHLANLCGVLEISADFLLSLNQSQDNIKETDSGLRWRTFPSLASDLNHQTLSLGLALFEHLIWHKESISALLKQPPFATFSVVELRRALRTVFLNGNIEILNVPRDKAREQRLHKHYGGTLRNVYVADIVLQQDWPVESALRTEIVACLAAHHAISTVPPAGTVGISGGNMMSRFVSRIPHALRALAGTKWISLIATGPENGFIPTDASALVAQLAHTQPHTTADRLPYLFPNLRNIDRFDTVNASEETYLSHVSRLQAKARDVDCVITSTGGPSFSPNRLDVDLGLGLMRLGDLLRRTEPGMRAACAGVILLHMINDDGTRWGTPELQAANASTFSSIELEDLSALVDHGRYVWFLIDRQNKARSTHAALISGRGNCLVADAQSADRLLTLPNRNKSGR